MPACQVPLGSSSHINHMRLTAQTLFPVFQGRNLWVQCSRQETDAWDFHPGLLTLTWATPLSPNPCCLLFVFAQCAGIQKASKERRGLDHCSKLSPAHAMDMAFTPRKPWLWSLSDSQCVGTSCDPDPASHVAPSRPMYGSLPNPGLCMWPSTLSVKALSKGKHPTHSCLHTQSVPPIQVP